MNEDGRCAGKQWRDHIGVRRIIADSEKCRGLGRGQEAASPVEAQGMPRVIAELRDALNERSQRRASVAEQNPEMSKADGAPCAGHRIVEWAEIRQPGEPEKAASHQSDAAVEGEPGRAAEPMQSQQHQAEKDDERGVVMVIFGGDGSAGEKNEMECAFEDVKRENNEAEDGGGVAVAHGIFLKCGLAGVLFPLT